MNPPDLDQRLAARKRPKGRTPLIYQKWRDLLFLHWPCSPEVIQRTLPDGLFVDTYESQAYVGIIPFFIYGSRPRFFPGFPGISNFLELNVRTYVYDREGVPGVWFYSLDAGPAGLRRRLVVAAARLSYFLPYFLADMHAEKGRHPGRRDEIHYTCRRLGTRLEMGSSFRYRFARRVVTAEPGSLDFFLVERYFLFSRRSRTGQLYRGQVHHRPYPLMDGEVSEWDTRILEVDGLTCQRDAPPVQFMLSRGVNVKIYAPQPVK